MDLPSPEIIRSYLESHFVKPPPGFFGRLLGEKPEYSHAVQNIEEHSASKFFESLVIFRLTVNNDYLPQKRLPVWETSSGLFFYDGKDIHFLDPNSPNKLVPILIKKKDIPDVELAQLLYEAGIPGHPTETAFIASFETLEKMTIPGHFGGDYRFNEKEVQRCASLIHAPHLTTSGDSSWMLTFFMLSGRLFDKNTLEKVEVTFTGKEHLSIQRFKITQELFSSVPQLRV